MKIHTFIADSAPEAVAQIRAQLGPDAVVLNVRKIEPDGLQKLWKKAQIEVLAHLPEPVAAPEPHPAPPPAPASVFENSRGSEALEALTELRREIAELKREMPAAREMSAPVETPARADFGSWKIGPVLEQAGLLPRHVHRVLDAVKEETGSNGPGNLVKELELVRPVLLKLGQSFLPADEGGRGGEGVQVFVGPPGSGKTTVLSKLLAQRVLLEGLPARALRLDATRANVAESLSVYCEILGVQVDRCLTPETQPQPGETVFIDLPGVPAQEPEGITALAAQIASIPNAQIHLVLNAAYETSTLLAQIRAYGFLPIADLIFSHLDEEPRWGKLLNFCFGTKFPISLLSAGQNVPGDFFPATAEKIVSRVIPSK